MINETKKTAIDLRPLSVCSTDEIVNSEGRIVALCMRGISEDPEIAAFIVKAVNNHDALVNLANDLLAYLKDEDDTFDMKYEARKILANL